MSELTPQELKRLRESQFVKFQVSDFKTIRQCFEIAKQLYEALKFFDSRASKFTLIPPNKRLYESKRRYSFPDEYYNFKSLDTEIKICRFRKSYNVCVNSSWLRAIY